MSDKRPFPIEWHTEDADEEAWQTDGAEQEMVDDNQRRQWLWIALVLLVVAVIGVGVYWQGERRVRVAEQAIIDDVLATHQLWHQAVWTQDEDIFNTVTADSPEAWVSRQQSLWRWGLLRDLAPMGLWGTETAVLTSTVTLSPDLSRALVTATVPKVTIKAGEPHTVTLQYKWRYKKVRSGWEMMPLFTRDPAFWGTGGQEVGERIVVSYTSRDEKVARRLATDLDALLAELCAVTLSCPPDFFLTIQFTSEEISLVRLNDRVAEGVLVVLDENAPHHYIMGMPTPVLVGVPLDEAGYEAVYRGYASWVAAALLDELSDEREVPLIETLEALQLQLPYPVDAAPLVQQEAPIPLPTQPVQLVCLDEAQPVLWRYDPVADEWQVDTALEEVWQDTPTRTIQRLYPLLSGGEGVLLITEDVIGGQKVWQLWHRQGDEVALWFTSDVTFQLQFRLGLRLHQNGRFYPLQFILSDSASNRLGTEFGLLDSQNCDETGCQLLSQGFLAYWSPNEERTLITSLDDNNLQLALGDERGQATVPLGIGWSPFWLSDERFGYVDTGGENALVGVNIVTRGTAVSETIPLLNATDLNAVIPEVERRNTLIIEEVFTVPNHPEKLVMVAFTVELGQVDMRYLYQYDIATEQLTLVTKGQSLGNALNVSTDGRFLVRMYYESPDWLLIAHNLEEVSSHTFPLLSTSGSFDGRYNWSADGEWLLVLVNGRLRFVAPAYDYEKHVLQSPAACTAAVWVKE